MKLTVWELERILEAIDTLIDERVRMERSTKSFLRLRAKVVSYAEKAGKRRV